jgi:dTDP-4-dehydrorhamnose reductase
MHILVFGKDGQLGRALKTVFDAVLPTLAHPPKIQYIGRQECDLSDGTAIDALLKQTQPKLIINAAAYTAVDQAEQEIDLAYAVNALAPEIMARFAVENQATLLHYSTDYVFDGEKYGFYPEDDIRNPLGVYGKSKAAGEEAIVRAFATQVTKYSDDSIASQYAIFRTSWVYGAGGNFIRTILRLAKERTELKVIEDQYGVPTSADWLASVSLNVALNSVGELISFPSGIYHAVPAGETSWYGLASLAVLTAREAGAILKLETGAIKPIPAVEYPLPAARPMNSRMATDKLQSLLALSASYFANSHNYYNEEVPSQAFPQWQSLVKEYVLQLVTEASTENK